MEPLPRIRWLRRAPQGVLPGADRARVGVLSGMFNPPTRAHLALAEAAREQLALGEVVFVLPETPPHKPEPAATLADRAAMLSAALGEAAWCSAGVCTHGLFVDIHRALAAHFPPGTEMFFLAGRDAAERILIAWPYADTRAALEEMFARFHMAVAGRGGGLRIPAGAAAAQYAPRIHALHLPREVETLSSTLARQRLARGQAVDDVVPAAVAALIKAKGLYGSAGS